MRLKIFLDMDDVVANFTDAACKVHKMTRKQLEARRIPGKWGMAEALGMPASEFWKPINDQGEEFWHKIHPTPYMSRVLELVNYYDTNWLIVSAPPPRPGNVGASYNGKIQWLERWFRSSDMLEFVSRKHMFARFPGAVLIDDREENVNAFRASGGMGIVFPHESNSLHAQAQWPIGHVSKSLEDIAQLLKGL